MPPSPESMSPTGANPEILRAYDLPCYVEYAEVDPHDERFGVVSIQKVQGGPEIIYSSHSASGSSQGGNFRVRATAEEASEIHRLVTESGINSYRLERVKVETDEKGELTRLITVDALRIENEIKAAENEGTEAAE